MSRFTRVKFVVPKTREELQDYSEALADIAWSCGMRQFQIPDSRATVQLFINWAQEFHNMHRDTDWVDRNNDYLIEIDEFITQHIEKSIPVCDTCNGKGHVTITPETHVIDSTMLVSCSICRGTGVPIRPRRCNV